MKKSVDFLLNETSQIPQAQNASTSLIPPSYSLMQNQKADPNGNGKGTHLLIVPFSSGPVATTATFSLAAVVRPRAVAAAAVAGLVEVRDVGALAAVAPEVGEVGAVAARVGEDGLAAHAGWEWRVGGVLSGRVRCLLWMGEFGQLWSFWLMECDDQEMMFDIE